MEHREKASSPYQTWREHEWPQVETQMVEFFAKQDETHLVNGKGVQERTEDRLNRSGGVESYPCDKCRNGVTELGSECSHCEKGVCFSFKPSLKRVDFATVTCKPCRGSGKVVWKNPYAELLEIGDTCPDCVGKGYVPGYSVIPGPDNQGPNTSSDVNQSAVMLPIALVLRRMETTHQRAHAVIVRHWGPIGSDMEGRCGRRDLTLWLGTDEGKSILAAYGDKTIKHPGERMAKLIKHPPNELCEHRVSKLHGKVLDLMGALRKALWEADRACGQVVWREANRRAELIK